MFESTLWDKYQSSCSKWSLLPLRILQFCLNNLRFIRREATLNIRWKTVMFIILASSKECKSQQMFSFMQHNNNPLLLVAMELLLDYAMSNWKTYPWIPCESKYHVVSHISLQFFSRLSRAILDIIRESSKRKTAGLILWLKCRVC